jgi:2-hydroxy-3-keto-5-methylthiopentenyl-1-phosphate phosphatase
MTLHPNTHSPDNLPLAVLVDFDGTITTRDIGDQVVIKFAEPGWAEALDRYRAGELNVRELWSYETGLLRKEREPEAVAFSLEFAEIRDGFTRLVEHCKSNGIPIEIASSGFHLYVDAILDMYGFSDLPRARPQVKYDDQGFGLMLMPDGCRDCGMTAMCKCDRVWRLRRKGYRVMFVGDGESDACVVSQADVVLATGKLRSVCDSKGIDYKPFETFHEVLDAVKEATTLSFWAYYSIKCVFSDSIPVWCKRRMKVRLLNRFEFQGPMSPENNVRDATL